MNRRRVADAPAPPALIVRMWADGVVEIGAAHGLDKHAAGKALQDIGAALIDKADRS